MRIATAESCTGGLISGALTAIPGSSDVYERGMVVYANEAKTGMLGVAPGMLQQFGAVSPEVARAMAEGALLYSTAHIAVSCTGIAGPGGGSAAKPVGLVYLGAAQKGAPVRYVECRFGDIGRDKVRAKTVEAALHVLLELTAAP